MSKIKNILLAGLSMVLVAALSIAGTVAYLQDDDSAVNVMTLGNVSIKQHEYERVVDADGNYEKITVTKADGSTQESYKLQEFTQAKPLYPAVGNPNGGYDPTYVRFEQLGDPNKVNGGQQFIADLNNAQDKIVLVENTGKTDAYVRTIFAFEMGKLTDIGEWHTIIKECKGNDGEPWSYEFTGVITIDGNNYAVMEAVYTGYSYGNMRHNGGILPAGEWTYNSLAEVYMTSDAKNEDVEAIDGNKNGTYDILVVSQAVQAAGFDNAETALDAAFGDITTDNHPWSKEAPSIPVLVDDADGLVAALENGEDVILTEDVKIDPAGMSNAYGTTGINVKNGQTIDGAGNTLDIKGAGGTWDSGINTTGGTIKNLTVTGSFRGIFINHNSTHSEPVILENVTIDGTTYTISCDQGMNQTLTATNSTFNGWTSFAATLGETTFIDCSFGKGNGYAYCRPYAPTTFVGCDFEAGYEMDPRAAVTFENCTIDGVALTADNLATLVTSNIANATVIK